MKVHLDVRNAKCVSSDKNAFCAPKIIVGLFGSRVWRFKGRFLAPVQRRKIATSCYVDRYRKDVSSYSDIKKSRVLIGATNNFRRKVTLYGQKWKTIIKGQRLWHTWYSGYFDIPGSNPVTGHFYFLSTLLKRQK